MKTTLAEQNGVPLNCARHQSEQLRENAQGKLFCRCCQRNQVARDRNKILQDVCGTSARAAREDMGA